MKKFIGQPIYVIMARYAYAGVLTEIEDKYIVLANAYAIEDSGAGTNSKPNLATSCGSSVILMIDAIETICQPVWVFSGEWAKILNEKNTKN